MSKSSNNIHTIDSTCSFVERLANHVLRKYGDDPVMFTKTLLLVPSRRAVQSLREAFLRESGGKPMLLPRMIALADLRYEVDGLLLGMGSDVQSEFSKLMECREISLLERNLLLAQMIASAADNEAQNKPLDGEAVFLGNANMSQSLQLAEALGKLLDELHQERISPEILRNIVANEELAKHWQKVLSFLEIMISDWSQKLRDINGIDAVAYRDGVISLLARGWAESPPDFPVIIAGTTGSVPATADLVKAVSNLPSGEVVLPALDVELDDSAWDMIDATHPQYGLKMLLEHVGCERGAVVGLESRHAELVSASSLRSDKTLKQVQGDDGGGGIRHQRQKLWQQMMLPAGVTHLWSDDAEAIDVEQALSSVSYIEADSDEQEALAIALQMRDALETHEKTAALVTHDRELAQRVAIILRYYGIEVDDTAGQSLSLTPAAVFFSLVGELCSSGVDAVTLLSLLKHPLCLLGREAGDMRHIARNIELKLLRGKCVYNGWNELLAIARGAEIEAESLAVLEEMQSQSEAFCELLQGQGSRQEITPMIEAHIKLAEQWAAGVERSGADALWKGYAGNQLADILQQIVQHSPSLGNIDANYYMYVIGHLLGGETYRPPYASHPRLHILSPIEARMQHYDMMILAGVNEGSFPAEPSSDPWMSRQMRKNIGLRDVEQSVGQSAHDFMVLSMADELVISRSLKRMGEPTIASRWLLRLETCLQAYDGAFAAMSERGNVWLQWANEWAGSSEYSPILSPAPCPDVAVRPRSLSATRIELLMRDPYSIYSQKILGLKPLEDIATEPDIRDFGNVVHEALERFYLQYDEVANSSAEEMLNSLMAIGEECFAELFDYPNARVFWWVRFERIAAWIIEIDIKQRGAGRTKVEVEQWLEHVLTLPAGVFKLGGRVDRIDVYDNGEAIISDYKTGAIPSATHVKRGIASQLPIEAWLLMRGNERLSAEYVGGLEYYKLSGSAKVAGEIKNMSGKDVAFDDEWIDGVEEGLTALLSHYDNSDNPYYCCPLAGLEPAYNDYTHLSRRAEWLG